MDKSLIDVIEKTMPVIEFMGIKVLELDEKHVKLKMPLIN